MDILLNGKKMDLGIYNKINDMQELMRFIRKFMGEGIVETVELIKKSTLLKS